MKICRTILALAALGGGWASTASGGSALIPGTPPSPSDVTARVSGVLPPDANVVLVVTDGAGQRSTPAGRALGDLLVESGALPEDASQAWSALARALSLQSPEAFDKLLGTHAMIVARCEEPWQLRRCEWVLLSEVPDETASALRRELAPSPRGIVHGMSVLSLEGGRLSLAVGAAGAELRRFGSWGQGSLLLMSPGDATGLFDHLLPLLRPEPAAPATASPESGTISRPDAFLLVRPAPGVADGGGAVGDQSLALTVGCAGDGWNMRFTTGAGALGLEASTPGTWSFKSLERMSPGAIAAVLASVSAQQPPALVEALFRAWPELARARDRFAGPMGLLMRERGGTLSATLATKVARAEEFQPEGDTAAAALALRLQGEAGELAIDRPFQGVLGPADIRDVRLEHGVETLLGQGFGEAPVLSWGYALDRDAPTGWWVVSVGASRTEDVDQFRGVLCCGPVANDGKKRVLTGLFRPAPLAEQSGAQGYRWLRHVERVSIDAWLVGPAGRKRGAVDSGRIEGDIELRMKGARADPRDRAVGQGERGITR